MLYYQVYSRNFLVCVGWGSSEHAKSTPAMRSLPVSPAITLIYSSSREVNTFILKMILFLMGSQCIFIAALVWVWVISLAGDFCIFLRFW